MDKPVSTFASGLIWFGAAVSIAEIFTGTLIAPLGFTLGLAALILGHLIGGIPLLLVALIGARTKLSAMTTVKCAFGSRGSTLFAGLNIVQLVGWTAVMIAAGTAAAEQVFSFEIPWLWPLGIATLIFLWILVGNRGLTVLSVASVLALLALCLLLSAEVFSHISMAAIGTGGATVGIADSAVATVPDGTTSFDSSLSFGSAVELSAAMSLSWLPLISDYTRQAANKIAAPVISVVVYTITSCWMFIIGLGAVLFTNQSDIILLLLGSGLGAAALPIIILSTVTTTFLDANSAGISTVAILPQINEKVAACAACFLGLVIALFAPVDSYEEFLYLIGSVFAPMSAILIVTFFILKEDTSRYSFDWPNLSVWFAGFCLSRLLVGFEWFGNLSPLGVSLPVMLATALLALLVAWVRRWMTEAGGKREAQK